MQYATAVRASEAAVLALLADTKLLCCSSLVHACSVRLSIRLTDPVSLTMQASSAMAHVDVCSCRLCHTSGHHLQQHSLRL